MQSISAFFANIYFVLKEKSLVAACSRMSSNQFQVSFQFSISFNSRPTLPNNRSEFQLIRGQGEKTCDGFHQKEGILHLVK